MKCQWCGFESDNIDDFEEDFKYHKGFWCPYCDGFTFYEGKEDYSLYNLILEEEGEEIKVKKQLTFDKHISPLRYPGGKSKLIDYIYNQLDTNKKTFVEAFCGGASVSLAMLKAGVVDHIVLNDLDFGIYSLFNSIIYDTEWLVQVIHNINPSKELYFNKRATILSNYKNTTEREAALAMLIVNRMAFSGIIKANPMNDLKSRWNPEKLIKRIKWIAGQRNHITLLNQPAKAIIEEYYWSNNNTLFIDPPYYKKGKSLYNLYYTERQHEELAELLNSLYVSFPGCADVIVTYDNDPFIKELYPLSSVKEIGRIFSISNKKYLCELSSS